MGRPAGRPFPTTRTLRQLFDIAAKKGISQGQIADELCTSRALVSSWYVGRHTPSAQVLEWLAQVVGAELIVKEKDR